jgi:hypothetical protein
MPYGRDGRRKAMVRGVKRQENKFCDRKFMGRYESGKNHTIEEHE